MVEKYFADLREGLNRAYSTASQARKKGLDPDNDVEVKIAKDVAARVEGIVGPPDISRLIRELIEKGMSREDAAFEIARKIAGGEIFKADKEVLIEQAVRTGVGILTEGVLVAPTEGISRVRIKQNPDGTDYVAVYYSGPIRSAGGTAAALSLVLADIARKVAGVGDYRATDTQIERYVEEVNTYEARVTHLQYHPPDDDVRHIVKNCPVCVDGDPTEDIEVSAYRGVPGVETNRIRGGVPLVICEGVAQKSAKLAKYTRRLNLGWDWLEKVIKIKRKADRIEIKPDDTYLDGLVAGRPVFSHPSTKGGFRLRYGSSKTNGIMAKNIHPATMALLDGFLAYGTHMKIERPGKGCVIAGHEGLEPPVVLLEDGSVSRVSSLDMAERIKPKVKQILFLGDLLITYGDFLKSNHPLLPSGWCVEWWEKELGAKGIDAPASLSAFEAFEFSRMHEVPLHPEFTFHWHDITIGQLKVLVEWLKDARLQWEADDLTEISIPLGEGKYVLEDLLVPHRVVDGNVILTRDDGYSLLASLGAIKEKEISLPETGPTGRSSVVHGTERRSIGNWKPETEDPLDIVRELSGITVKPKAPTYIGGRMGRPEKAKERAMDGKPNCLFPTGSQNRSIVKRYKTLKVKEGSKTVNLDIVRYRCGQCSNISLSRICDRCGKEAKPDNVCQVCGRSVRSEEHCERKTRGFDRRPIDFVDLLESAKAKLGFMPADVKGVKGLSNPMRIPEKIEKGFLRSQHDVYVFRDGTSRFDATDIPLSAFSSADISTPLDKLKELGYEKDVEGSPLERPDQTMYLRHQDIVLSEAGATYFMRVAAFLDEMLVNLYGMKPFYNLKSRDDLIGHLCVGLSPHTSAGVLCRIIGFTKANVGYAHPYFHTAKRRNCFYPNTEIVIWDEKQKRFTTDELGKIVEHTLNHNPKTIKQLDQYTVRVDAPENLYTLGIDSKTDKVIRKKIKSFIKTEPPEKWIKITTAKNRKMAVTPNHNILILEKEKLASLEASELKVGTRIPVSSKWEPSISEIDSIDQSNYVIDKIKIIETFSEGVPAYCLDVEADSLIDKNVLLNNQILTIRCDGDEDSLMLLLDALLNFSRKYLNEKKGGTMDAPLVLTPEVDPMEVDDEAHTIEFVNSYPLEFYHAAEKITLPGDVKIKTVKSVLGKPEQYSGLPITHPGGSLDSGPIRTKYVQLDSIPDKITTQFDLQLRIKAVDAKNAAERLILSHFIPDLYGNLRSFSRQSFRCTACHLIHRRPPLSGRCLKCGGNLILTINKGGIKKYLEISRKICEDYDLPIYLKQRLVLVEREIKSIFEDDKIKQTGLADFL